MSNRSDRHNLLMKAEMKSSVGYQRGTFYPAVALTASDVCVVVDLGLAASVLTLLSVLYSKPLLHTDPLFSFTHVSLQVPTMQSDVC